MPAMRRFAAWPLTLLLIIAATSFAQAQGADIRITELDCNSSPERVVIQNVGDESQDMSGWAAQSDPPDAETLDLSGLVVLEPGESVALQSQQQIELRDDDPTDYVRIVDQTGATVHEVHCDGVILGTPAPSDALESDVASEAAGAADVPNGGGAPAVDGAGPATTLLILIGGVLAIAGLATSAITWRGVSHPPLRLTPTTAKQEPVTAYRPRPQLEERNYHLSWAVASASALAALGAATALVVMFRSRRTSRRS